MDQPDPFHDLEHNGYAIVRDPGIAGFKADICDSLRENTLFIARRLLSQSQFSKLPRSDEFDVLLDAIHKIETDNQVTRTLYEVFPTLTPVIAMINHPLIRKMILKAGIRRPSAGTLPLIRLDRPGDTRFSTPAHQDSWYSLLSSNAITLWTPLCHMDDDMGLLGVLPGSHLQGVCPFKPYQAGHEWFETTETIRDEDLTPVKIGYDQLLIFNQSLIHKSGHNASARVRISVQLRFNDLETAQSLTATFTPSLSRYVLEKQKAHLDGQLH